MRAGPRTGDITMNTRLILLTTPMRSGSTLLSRMLSAHPDVDMSYDSVNFFRFCHGKYDPIDQPGNAARLVKDMAHRLLNRFGLKLDVEKCLQEIERGGVTYGSAYSAILRTLFPDVRKKILGDKESMAWTRIPAFLEMSPRGQAVIIVRDPRDVVNSFRKTTIAPGNDYLIALFDVVDAVNHAVRYVARDPKRVHMVRFERLKLEPVTELGDLCRFLGIDLQPQMTSIETFTDHSGKKWNAAESLSFPEETDPLAPVGRWRKQIAPEDLFLCEWIAGQQIRTLGLAPSGRTFSQSDFDLALAKVTSTPLLREAFKRWCETGEGSERFPLDPTNPKNWDPNWVRNPEAFSAQ
jgi:hypothetical protein